MDSFKLKIDAAISLHRAAYPPRKLIAIHSGVTIAVTLAIALLTQILGSMVDSAGGLSSLGNQAVLSTAQSILQIGQAVALPFWAAGLVYLAISIATDRPVGPRNLLGGFRKWKPLLFSSLMVSTQYLVRILLCAFLSIQLMLLTPLATPLIKASEAINADPSLSMSSALGSFYVPTMAVSLCLFAGLLMVLLLPLFYRLRLVNHLIMGEEKIGGAQAIFTSRLLMQQRRMELFKLDLSFWWYYLLEILSAAMLVGDLLLELAGIRLPISGTAVGWCFLLLGSAMQFGLHLWAKPRVCVTYAQFYTQVRKAGPVPPKAPQPTPKNVPWSY